MKVQGNRGFVLVFSLLLLLTMTLVGISLMSGSQMQERMSGNARLQTIAFQSASAGASGAIEFVESFRDATGNSVLPACGTSGPGARESWEKDWAVYDEETERWVPRPTRWIETPVDVGTLDVKVVSRVYCLWPTIGDGLAQPRSQAFVESQATVRIGTREVAARSAEVRLRSGRIDSDGLDICATRTICKGDDTSYSVFDTLGMSSSGAFTMGGEDQHAMCVCNTPMRDELEAAIIAQPNGTYEGMNGTGVDAFEIVEPVAPWDSVTNVRKFADLVKDLAEESKNDYSNGFNSNNASFGTREAPQITYIDGDFESGGNPSGAGILVVNGDFTWTGNGQFDGLVVVLGSNYTVTGGGNGGVNGQLVFSPIKDGDFDYVTIDFHKAQGQGQGGGAGGGNATYQHDCEILVEAEKLLGDPDVWKANCEGGVEDIFEVGPKKLQLVSWRENLGWREQAGFFGKPLGESIRPFD